MHERSRARKDGYHRSGTDLRRVHKVLDLAVRHQRRYFDLPRYFQHLIGQHGGHSLLIALVFAVALSSAGPSYSFEKQTVDRFVRLSEQFHARLPASQIAGLSTPARRNRAVCILTRFETAFGGDGVRSLMGLMGVLSKGAEFDDATIVAFNDRFGPQYDRIVTRCTRNAGS